MSKNLVPIELPLINQTPASPLAGFAKVYLRTGYTKILHATGPERDLVLDRPLDNFNSVGNAVIVTSSDTVFTGIEKLQRTLLRLKLAGFINGTATYSGGFLIVNTTIEPLTVQPTPYNVFYDPLTNKMTYAQATTGPQGTTGAQGIQGLQGVQGTTGIQGAQGLEGIQGIQGIQGPQGVQGIQGLEGIQGIQGTQGVQGTDGIQGIQGTQGPEGLQGIQGVQGLQGPQGVQGLQGVQGVTGLQGTQGTQGLQGIQGITGSQGSTGTQGIQGIQGVQGIVGQQGTTGTQGVQGVQGLQGITGIQGTQGTNGIQGLQGIQGIQGIQGMYGQWYISDTAPTTTFEGMVWYNTSNGKRYLRYDNYWVQDGDNHVASAIPQVTTTQRDALLAVAGQTIFNTTEGYLETYDNFWGWMPVSSQNEWKRKWGWEYWNDFGSNNGFNDGVLTTFPTNGGAASITTVPIPSGPYIGFQGLRTGSTTANGTSVIRTDVNIGRYKVQGFGKFVFETAVFIRVLSTSTDRFTIYAGENNLSTASTTINTGTLFAYDEGGVGTGTIASPNWQIITANAGVRTVFVTSIPVVANTMYKLRLEINDNSTEVKYYINDVLVRTETTNVPPQGQISVQPIVGITKSIGTTDCGIVVDYIGMKKKFTTPR